MVFFRDKVGGAINNNYVKALILLVFSIYLIGAGYGLTQIKEGLERRKLSKEDSYSVKFFDLEDEFYREFPYRMQVIVTGDYNYSDPVSNYVPFLLFFNSFSFHRFSHEIFDNDFFFCPLICAGGTGKIRIFDRNSGEYIVCHVIVVYRIMASLIFVILRSQS